MKLTAPSPGLMLTVGAFFTFVYVGQFSELQRKSPEQASYMLTSAIVPLVLSWAFFYGRTFRNSDSRKFRSFAAAFLFSSFYAVGTFNQSLKSAPQLLEDDQIPVIAKQTQAEATEVNANFTNMIIATSKMMIPEKLADKTQYVALEGAARNCETQAHAQLPEAKRIIKETIDKINALHADEELKKKVIGAMEEVAKKPNPLAELSERNVVSICELYSKMVALAEAATPSLSADHKLQFAAKKDADTYEGYLRENDRLVKETEAIYKEVEPTVKKLNDTLK
jgi:hypothetical protein